MGSIKMIDGVMLKIVLIKWNKFSQDTVKLNKETMVISRSPPRKEKSKRDKALEFAMKIKKPKLKAYPERLALEFEETKERNKLWEQEQNDKQMRFELEKIKLLFKL